VKIDFSRQIFVKYSNVHFRENSSNESQVVPCGQKDGRKHRRTDMTKLSDAFQNFAKASKMFELPSARNIC
jgi:hypothetical protein